MYTCTRALPNGHLREENRACRTSRRGSLCVSGSWTVENEVIPVASWTAKSPDTPTSSRQSLCGKDVRVGVGVRVGAVECQLYRAGASCGKTVRVSEWVRECTTYMFVCVCVCVVQSLQVTAVMCSVIIGPSSITLCSSTHKIKTHCCSAPRQYTLH